MEEETTQQEEVTPIGALLFEYHMIYQQKLHRVVTQKEFAEHIGIGDKYYNHISRGRRKPSRKTTKLLAEFFGDLRFYDAAGEPRPDPNLFYIQRHWEDVPDAIQKKIAETVSKYVPARKKK